MLALARSFGYDQGMMSGANFACARRTPTNVVSGVNTSPDYVRVMKLGYSTYVTPVLQSNLA